VPPVTRPERRAALEGPENGEGVISVARIVAVCVSEKKGTQKKDVGRGVLVAGHGLEGDAHAGPWHRQVSLLGVESVEKMRAKGLELEPGAFGENLLVEGLDLTSLPLGVLMVVRGAGEPAGEAAGPGGRFPEGWPLLELTQIGKECHDRCAIYHAVGDCVMPREGVFVRVLRGGPVAAGDHLEVLSGAFRVAVLTASDKGSRGEREDVSGETVRQVVEEELGWPVVDHAVVPDEREAIAARLRAWADEGRADLVLTTGGTGLGPRDVTPDATLDIAERVAPGIAEAIRAYGLTKTSRAMLSRGAAVVRGRTLIINLPGSPRGVRESLEAVKPALGHGLEILTGRAGECGHAE